MAAAKDTVIPCWDGDPSTFETYCTACRWYERGTKQTERSLVVARLWGQLTGAAQWCGFWTLTNMMVSKD